MLADIIRRLFPNYYKRIWNAEINKQLEELRQELYVEYPNSHNIVDSEIAEAFERWRK